MTPKNLEHDCRGQNTLHWGIIGTVGKVLKCRCPKWPRIAIWTYAAQVMVERRAGSQTGNLTPDHQKSESTRFRCVQVKCDTPLESSRGELQLWFRLCPDPSLGRGAMSVQSPGSLNRNSFGTPLWESQEKEPFGCRCGGELQRILYGGK